VSKSEHPLSLVDSRRIYECPQLAKTGWIFSLVLLAILTLPLIAIAGPGEEANAVIDRWSAAYSSNDPDTVVKTYRPNAILLGTVSPILSEGIDAIRAYFSNLKGSGNKNAIGEWHTMVLNDNAVVVTGFYDFTRMKGGQPVPGPSRFTMLLIKDGGEWLIAHHHSSPRSQPAN
jgi:uncharacterized protein (TIGR02246 family)